MADPAAIAAAALLALGVVATPSFRRFGYRPLDTPRVVLVCAGAAGLLAVLVALGRPVPSGPAFGPALGVWLLAGAVAGRRPAIHADRLLLMAAAWWLGACVAPGAGALAPSLLAVAAGVVAVVHLWQVVTHRPLWDAMGSLAGNTNLLGTFLVPCFFFALPVSRALAALLVASLLCSRCRAALVGLAAGMAAVLPTSAAADAVPAAAAGAVLFMFVKGFSRMAGAPFEGFVGEARSWANPASARSRCGIWRCALLQAKRQWLCGGGLDSLKLSVARRRVEAGGVGTFRKAHSDALQLAVDAGLIGVALWAALWSAALGTAAGSGQALLLAALVGQLAAGGDRLRRDLQADRGAGRRPDGRMGTGRRGRGRGAAGGLAPGRAAAGGPLVPGALPGRRAGAQRRADGGHPDAARGPDGAAGRHHDPLSHGRGQRPHRAAAGLPAAPVARGGVLRRRVQGRSDLYPPGVLAGALLPGGAFRRRPATGAGPGAGGPDGQGRDGHAARRADAPAAGGDAGRRAPPGARLPGRRGR